MIKIKNLKLVILLDNQNIKTFLQKPMSHFGLKKFFLSKNLKTLCHGHMLLVTMKAKKLLEIFTKRNCRKQVKKSLELKKSLKEKMINYMLNGKTIIILLTNALIKKT